MTRAATLALAFLALAAAANANVVTKILINPAFPPRVNIDRCIALINALNFTGSPFQGGFNALTGTGFCPTNAALNSFLNSIGCRGSCTRSTDTIAAFLTANQQIIPYITRIMTYHRLAPQYGLVFGSEFSFWVNGRGGGSGQVFKTQLVRDPSQTVQTLEIGLINPNLLRVRGANLIGPPHNNGNTATSTFLNAAINTNNATVPPVPLAVIHAINRVLLPYDYYFTPTSFFSAANNQLTSAYYNATFSKYFGRAVSANSRTYGNATNPIMIFAASDAGMANLDAVSANTGVTLAQYQKSANLRGALLRYATAFTGTPALGYGDLLTNVLTLGGKRLVNTLLLLGATQTTQFQINAAGLVISVNGTGNTAGVKLPLQPVTVFAGAATIYWSNAGALVPTSTGV